MDLVKLATRWILFSFSSSFLSFWSRIINIVFVLLFFSFSYTLFCIARRNNWPNQFDTPSSLAISVTSSSSPSSRFIPHPVLGLLPLVQSSDRGGEEKGSSHRPSICSCSLTHPPPSSLLQLRGIVLVYIYFIYTWKSPGSFTSEFRLLLLPPLLILVLILILSSLQRECYLLLPVAVAASLPFSSLPPPAPRRSPPASPTHRSAFSSFVALLLLVPYSTGYPVYYYCLQL